MRYCASPSQALQLASGRRFDVLVTDLKMPGMDGLGPAVALRESDQTLPVLLVTAHASVGAAMRAVRGSVTDFLTKPAKADAVCTAVDAAARTRRHLSSTGRGGDGGDVGGAR